MAKNRTLFIQARHARVVSPQSVTPGKAERVLHQVRESEMADVCLGCVLEECAGGGRHCPYVLKKKEKKHERRE